MENFKNHAHAFILFIDECLKSQGKSRYWLSKQTGISAGQLSQYFNLEVIPGLDIFLRMLYALEINIFFKTRNDKTNLNKEFERAMDRLGRRPNDLNKN